MAQLVEHIVHIDGVTGSSPVATTKPREALKTRASPSFLGEPTYIKNGFILEVNGVPPSIKPHNFGVALLPAYCSPLQPLMM